MSPRTLQVYCHKGKEVHEMVCVLEEAFGESFDWKEKGVSIDINFDKRRIDIFLQEGAVQ